MKIKYNPIGDRGKIPIRKHYNDAGADIWAPEDIYIPKGSTKKVPLGFGLEVPDGYMACVYTRSSMAAKGLACETLPIDSGYQGEIHAIITNHTGEMQKLKAGSRIGQIVIHPIAICDFVEELGDEREDGAFGSTGE